MEAGLVDMVLVYIGKGVGDEFEGDPVEGTIGKFDGEGFFAIGFSIGILDAIKGGMVFAIVFGDVELCAGCCACYEEGQGEKKDMI